MTGAAWDSFTRSELRLLPSPPGRAHTANVDPAGPERILLVRLSALGDVAQCLPALASLRASRPDAQIGWLVEDRNAGLLERHPHVDRLFVFGRRAAAAGAMAGLREVRRLRAELRAWRADVAVDLQGNLKSGFLTRLSGARRRIGLPHGEAREGAHLFVTETVPAATGAEHRAERAMRLVRAVGATTAAPAALPEIAALARTNVGAALAALGVERGRYVLLVPGTSDFGAFKRWPAARFGQLAARLRRERGLPVLVAWGPGQRELAEGVVQAAEGAARLAPATSGLHELLALLSGAAAVIGADSGPLALSSIAGVPSVVLFGPKDPAVYAPRGPATEVVWKRVYCSPCVLRQGGDPICMTTMEVGEGGPAVQSALDAK